MTGEALSHQHPDPEHEAKILPFRTKDGQESMDFSRVPAELATEMFVSQLTHPSHMKQHGVELSHTVTSGLATPRSGRDPTTLNGRLSELRESADMFADYDGRIESDVVFGRLINFLETTKDTKSLSDQRKATRLLVELRSAVRSHKTSVDGKWLNIIDRLST